MNFPSYSQWRELLRPGGKLIFTNGLPIGDARSRSFSAGQTASFRELAVAELESRDPIAGWDNNLVADLAEAYGGWRHNTQVTQDEIQDLVVGGGFDIDQLESVVIGKLGVSGPGTTERRMSARVIATRR